MYENRVAKAWEEETPGLPTDPRHLSTEAARWDLLTKQPLFLTADILQYGPLTVDGYISARQRSYANTWPVEPTSIAKVLVTCGVDATSAGYAATAHVRDMSRGDMTFASALVVHVEVLRMLDIPLNSELLLDAIADVRWGTSDTEEYVLLFNIMKQYLHGEDASEFLHKFLPAVEPGGESYGLTSLGLALAQAFPTCNPSPLIAWCRKHDDQQALGYLVWQGRLSLKDWLDGLADPDYVAASRDSHGDYFEHHQVEQTATFYQIIEKLPAEKIEQECIDLANNPAALNELMLRTHKEPASTASISWVACLARAGALPAEHPLMLDWVERADLAQNKIVSAGFSSKDISRFTVGSEFYRDLRPAFVTHGSRVRNVVARHMALNMATYHFYTRDIEWLTTSPIASVLCALPGENGRGIHQAAAVLFFCLGCEDKAIIAMHIMRSVIKRESSAKEVLKLLKQQDMSSYDGLEITPGQEVFSLLRAITKLDVAPLIETCNALGVSEQDPMFHTAIDGFVQSAFLSAATGQSLPELETSEARSY